MESTGIDSDLTSFFGVVVRQINTAVGELGTRRDARSVERLVIEQSHALGALMLEKALQKKGLENPPVPSLPCGCGHRMHRKYKRPMVLRCVIGNINLTERYYYRCDNCKSTRFVGDEMRGHSVYSALADDLIAYVGIEHPFAKAVEILQHVAFFVVAASTVRKVCGRLGRSLRNGECGSPGKPDEDVKRLALSVDGVMLGRADEQHRKRRSRKTNRKVRGKTALAHFFCEVKLLVAFDFDGAGKALKRTFHATQDKIDEFRKGMIREASLRGAESAKLLVFLGDGAAWVWKTAEDHFPDAVQILDWYHAMQHVWASGRALHGSREKELKAWARKVETDLWNGRRDAVIEAMRALSEQLGAPDQSLSETARAADPRWIAHRNVHYFESNRDRINYPEYRKKHLPVGSGAVESACKQLVAQRMKRSGMRWDHEGAENILSLRSLALSGRWDWLWTKNAAA
jgi:hypothetical protein